MNECQNDAEEGMRVGNLPEGITARTKVRSGRRCNDFSTRETKTPMRPVHEKRSSRRSQAENNRRARQSCLDHCSLCIYHSQRSRLVMLHRTHGIDKKR